jgi:CubicO group peptidase (beta-lactamase class C family)
MRYVLLLALLAPSAQAAAPDLFIDAKQLRAELEAVHKKNDLPAMGVAIVRSSGVALVDVVGVRKRGGEAKATADDQFHIGSDTKTMTAMLVALLVQDKKLTYDMTLEKALPDLAKKMHKDFRAVTLEQLLTHRAGLVCDLPGGWWKIPRNVPTSTMRTSAAKAGLEEEPDIAPGVKFAYSNLGYVIGGAICERAGKDNWESLMKKRIFGPLGMKSAGFGPMGTRGKVDQPLQHGDDGKPVEPGPNADNPPVMGPAGRVHCTLGDWGKFMADQLKGARGEKGLLPGEAYKKLHQPLAKGLDYTPGGWLYYKLPTGVILSHDGSNTQNYAAAILIPSKDIAILIVTNQGGKKANVACHQLRDALLKKLLK